MEYIKAKTIVTRTKSSAWFGTDYTMNIYRGCCHGCIYCDSRSCCYRIDNFDSVQAKENALEIIRDDLRRKVKTGVIGTGAMSDPYNPFEEHTNLTRHALELIYAYSFGVSIATKSPLVTRDIDILTDIKKTAPVIVIITITTSDDVLSEKIEKNAAVSSKRFKALKLLSDSGIFCGITLMPVLPFITDTNENITDIVRLAKESGAKFVYPAFGVTLRENQRDYYFKQLDESFPGLKERYITRYKNRYSCGAPNARVLFKGFSEECEKHGLFYKMNAIIQGYKSGYEYEQTSLF